MEIFHFYRKINAVHRFPGLLRALLDPFEWILDRTLNWCNVIIFTSGWKSKPEVDLSAHEIDSAPNFTGIVK